MRNIWLLLLALLMGCATANGRMNHALSGARATILFNQPCRSTFDAVLAITGNYRDTETMLRTVLPYMRPVSEFAADARVPENIVGKADRENDRIYLNAALVPTLPDYYLVNVFVHEYGHMAGVNDARPIEEVCLGRVLSKSP